MDYKKIISLCSKQPVNLTVTETLSQHIDSKEMYVDKRSRLGVELKNHDPKLLEQYEQYKAVVDAAMVRPLRPRQMWDSFFLCAMQKASNFSVPGSGKTASVLGMYAYLRHKELGQDLVVRELAYPVAAYTALCDLKQGKGSEETVMKLELLMNKSGVTTDIFPAVAASLKREKETKGPAGAMVLPDGRIVTGRTSKTLGAASAMLLNALKVLAGIEDEKHLIASHVLEPICDLKTGYMGHRNPRLHTDEVLLALTISALADPVAQQAKEQLKNLRGSQAHFTVILSEEDEKLLRRLGIHVSFEAKYETRKLYHK